MGQVVKFVDPDTVDPASNAVYNTLKNVKKAYKRGQLEGIAVIIVNKGQNNVGSFWSVEENGAFGLLAACDHLKQEVWRAINESKR